MRAQNTYIVNQMKMDRMLSGVAYVLYNEPTSTKSYISS